MNFMMGMTFAGFPPLNPSERQIPFAAEPSPIVEGLGLLEHSQSNTEESMKQAWFTCSWHFIARDDNHANSIGILL